MTEESTGPVKDVETWLLSLAVHPSARGEEALSLARALVDELDNPQRAAPAVHIIGTAGKGAAASLLTDMIVRAGHSVATHVSPHVYDIRERFTLDGEFPDDDALATALATVRVATGRVLDEHGRPPTFFAASAALSWVLGRDAGVDVFVTEAGIGGRLDATAVHDRPDTVTVITNIGLDHTDVLGETVREIAMEKVAVISGRRDVILAPQTYEEAREVVVAQSQQAGSRLVEVPAMGGWRADAAATADQAMQTLVSRHGFERARFRDAGWPPGRHEVRELAGRRLLLDGAHNPLKIAALIRDMNGEPAPSVAVVALGAGKDLAACGSELVSLGCPIVVTEFGGDDPPYSHAAKDVAAVLQGLGADCVAEPNLPAATRRALAATEEGDTILVTGSFLILADVVAAMAG